MRNGRLLAVCLLGVASLVTLPAAHAATTNLKAEMTGAEEVPGPGDPDGKGSATVVVDDAANSVCHELTYTGLGKVTAAHIHTGAKGVAGPPAVTLKGDKGCTNVDPTTAKAIRDDPGSHYVNIHTDEYKSGAIRGQLMQG
ncbi:MAG TPA: CHRD domain-containing protein [Acidimicrobiia bacterium]|nr:CHRD domain-containing protein [Acidimicrobiia bacterium]